MGLARRDRGARRKAMSVHTVDDEQRRDRKAAIRPEIIINTSQKHKS